MLDPVAIAMGTPVSVYERSVYTEGTTEGYRNIPIVSQEPLRLAWAE